MEKFTIELNKDEVNLIYNVMSVIDITVANSLNISLDKNKTLKSCDSLYEKMKNILFY